MRVLLIASIGCLILAGCSQGPPKGALTGTVKYNNQPVNGATLFLEPSGGTGAPFAIPVSQEGTFSIQGVPAGDYKIRIEGSEGAKAPSTKGMTQEQIAKMKDRLDALETKPTIPFPDKYKQTSTSGLSYTVKKGAN